MPLLRGDVTNLGSRDWREQHRCHRLVLVLREASASHSVRRAIPEPGEHPCQDTGGRDVSPAHRNVSGVKKLPWSPPSLKSSPADRKNMSHEQGCSGPE